jgi:hypothetical protein
LAEFTYVLPDKGSKGYSEGVDKVVEDLYRSGYFDRERRALRAGVIGAASRTGGTVTAPAVAHEIRDGAAQRKLKAAAEGRGAGA